MGSKGKWSVVVAVLAASLGLAALQCSAFGTDTSGSSSTSSSSGGSSSSSGNPDGGPSADGAACGGRDCGPGGCNANGLCLPDQIGVGPSPWYLTVDATTVYWTSNISEAVDLGGGDGKLRRASKEGGGQTSVIAQHDAGVWDVHSNGTGTIAFTVFAQNGGMFVFSNGSGAVTEAYSGYALDITSDSLGTLFFTSSENVRKVSSVTSSEGMGGSTVNAEGITSDETNVYFTTHTSSTEGTIEKVGKDYVGPSIITEAPGARRLIVDETHLYWTADNAISALCRHSKSATAGDGEETFIYPLKGIRYGALLGDGQFLYVAQELEGRVVRINKDGTNLTTLVENLQGPTDLAQDDKTIYFTERTANRVMAIRK